jgi:hypothetical protein
MRLLRNLSGSAHRQSPLSGALSVMVVTLIIMIYQHEKMMKTKKPVRALSGARTGLQKIPFPGTGILFK